MKSRLSILSVSQSTFLLVLQKMTACVMVSVSYRSHRVSSFHSYNVTHSSQLGKQLLKTLAWLLTTLVYVNDFCHRVNKLSINLSFHLNVELPDTLKGQFFLFDQDSDRIPHELLGDIKDFDRHGGRQQDNLQKQAYLWNHSLQLVRNLKF